MLKNIYEKYRHGLLMLGYACIYLPWFIYLERTVTKRYHVIHMDLDDLIPFNEYFIVPYLLWFGYVAAVLLFTFFKDKGDYYRMCGFMFTGMTVFLIVSTVFPNGHHLRPAAFAQENIFTALVAQLYSTDTPTNLFPSIHVYNSIAAHLAVMHSESLRSKRWISAGSFLLCVSIILSTVFLKQHSIFDMITAFMLAGLMYPLVYRIDYAAIRAKRKELRRRPI